MSTSASEELLKTDWYAVLLVSREASDETIAKAARKMGLKYHPDKSDDPKDHELFLLVQKAKEILLDVGKRSEYDKHINAVAARKEYESERERGMDSRRKRMRDELESKLFAEEQSSKVASSATSSSAHMNSTKISGSNKNKMADDNVSFMEREREREREHLKKEAEAQMTEDKTCQVKLKWKRNKVLISHSDDSLYQLFKVYGDIEDVILTGDTGNAATITFNTKSAAMKACEAYSASTDYRLSILDGSKKKAAASIFTHVYTEKHSPGYTTTPTAGSQEDELAEAIRRSMQRDALIREMEAAERSESGQSSPGSSARRASGASSFFKGQPSPRQTPSGELHQDFSELAHKYGDGDFVFSWEYLAKREAQVLNM